MIRLIALALVMALTQGCASFAAPATQRLAANLSTAILNQDDAATVRDGAPAYLLLVDSLIEGDPDNSALLFTGARLYGAYAGAFVTEEARSRRLAARALDYARRGLCIENPEVCAALDERFSVFNAALERTTPEDAEALYLHATAWAGWVQASAGDWQALADLPKIRVQLERVVVLREDEGGGGAHAYLGVLNTLLPPSVGGRPEVGRAHFERALTLSGGRNLMYKVLYARHYARLVFDRELHDRLLREVIDAPVQAPQLTLINTLAQEQAQALLASANQYF
jgi:hypothetical protein